jgi:multiple sugar transport system substrate-binding protein
MKALFRLFAALVVGLLVLAACQPAATQTPAATQPPAADTPMPEPTAAGGDISGTIRVGSWDGGDGLAPFNAAIESFKAQYPNVEVVLESVPQGYGDKLLTQFSAGNAPDVFQVGDGDAAKFAAQGVLEPLEPYINGDNPLDMGVFYPAVAAIGQVQGQTYLLTKDWSPLVLFYNKALFDAAGVEYPNADWTWDDMLTAAKALTVSGEQWGIQIPNSWGDPLWYRGLSPLVYQNGGSFISEDGTKATGFLNSPETVEAIQWYVDLFTTHKVSPTKADVEALAGVDLFQTGRVAMLWTGRWPLADFQKNAELNFGTAGLPQGKERANSICWAGFAMYSEGQNKDAAWAFLKWIAAEQGAEEFAKYAFTAVQPIAEEQGLDQDPYNAAIVADAANVRPLPEMTNQKFGPCVETPFKEELERVFLEGKGVQEAMDAAAEKADTCLAQE